MPHDEYYNVMPNSEVLAKELDKYIRHIEDCLEEDCLPEIRLDMQSQLYAAKAVRENVRRVYDE